MKTTGALKFLKFLIVVVVVACALISNSYQTSAFSERQRHINLLTVSDSNETETGGIADLYLALRPGSGAVYIDSFPLTKLDTQISLRVAQQIACDFVETDCTEYDFFYRISTGSSLVSGPSAGAAMTVLTIAALENIPLDNRTIMTGTINSGGVIGPVAGVKAKANAAMRRGFTTVLVPKWDIEVPEPENGENRNSTNSSMPLSLDSFQLFNVSARMVKVSSLREAVFHFTGKQYSLLEGEIEVPQEYSSTMNEIASQLCARVQSREVSGVKETGTEMGTNTDSGNKSTVPEKASGKLTSGQQYWKAMAAIDAGSAYSAASYCFSAAVAEKEALYSNYTGSEREEKRQAVAASLEASVQRTDATELKSLSDLETYMIVKERLGEAGQILEEQANISARNLAYAEERIASAEQWSKFFHVFNRKALPDNNALEQTCIAKINEAEERVNYVYIYYPAMLDREELDKAREAHRENQHALCIFSATKAKAHADTILTAVYLEQAQIRELVSEKLFNARQVLLKQQKHEVFPLLGYSYYEYADSLKAHDPASAAIYSEYSMELGNLEVYFPVQKAKANGMVGKWQALETAALAGIVGAGLFFIGGIAGFTLGRRKGRQPRQAGKKGRSRKKWQ